MEAFYKNDPPNELVQNHKSPTVNVLPPETNIALENRPSHKEISSSNHPFPGAMLFLGRVTLINMNLQSLRYESVCFFPVPSFPQMFDRVCQKKHKKSPKHQGNRTSAESSCVGLITDNTNSSCNGPTPGSSHKFHAEEWLNFARYIGNHFPAKHITNLELQTTSLQPV